MQALGTPTMVRTTNAAGALRSGHEKRIPSDPILGGSAGDSHREGKKDSFLSSPGRCYPQLLLSASASVLYMRCVPKAF